jgi:hypothetical protein
MFGRSIVVPLTVSALLFGCATAAEDETQEIVDNLIQAPTTSPAAASRTFSTTSGFTCESGYACALVPYANGWYTFKFYYYGTYYLSNWLGTGVAFNDQTGGAAMRLLDSSGGQLECIPGVGSDGIAQFDNDVDWGPIWRIQLTSSNC